jgi:gliding motility associated protien GldN
MKKIGLVFSGLFLTSVMAFAQPTTGANAIDPNTNAQPEFLKTVDSWKPSLRPDGVVDKVPHRGYVAPWQPIRENDVLWRKRVWLMIDVLQKQNFAFRYPGDEETGGGTFIEILLNAIKKGEVTAFDPSDDRFTSPLEFEAIQTKLQGKADSVEITNPVTGEVTIQYSRRDFKPEDITKYRIKEDVIFDRNLGRAVKRIIGIAPVFDKYDPNTNEYRGSQTLFWLYYKDLRPVLARYEVYNGKNDVFRLTWDDFFEKQMFSSYVTKSTLNNISQDDIRGFKSGIDRLYESEKVKESIFNFEHDLWVY